MPTKQGRVILDTIPMTLFLRITLNTLIGIVLIFIWLKIVDLNATLEALKQVNYLILIPCFIVLFLSSALKSLRLKLLLSEFKIPFKNILGINLLSQLLSFLIPIRAGEVAKSVYLSKEFKIPFAKTIIWIFLDRFLDFWVILISCLLLLLTLNTTLPNQLIFSLSSLIVAFSLITLLILFVTSFFQKLVNFFCIFLILKPFKKMVLKIAEFIIECTSLLKNSLKVTSLLFVYTFLSALAEGVVWFILLKSLIEAEFLKVFLGSMLSALTYLIPAAPGYVGSAEAAGLAVFNLGLGFDKTTVSAVTVIYHALILIYMLVFGLGSLYLLKFDLRQVWNKLRNKS